MYEWMDGRWKAGEHEKGSHGDGGGEGYLKYLKGSLRDEANQGRPVPQTPSIDIVEDEDEDGDWDGDGEGPQGLAPRWSFPSAADASPGDGIPALPGQVEAGSRAGLGPGPGESD